MRKTLYREEREDLGAYIHQGAMIWADEIPVTWQFGYGVADVLGRAYAIRREPNGDVTARIDLNDNERGRWAAEILQNEDGACSIWANEIKQKQVTVGEGAEKHKRRDILHGRIRQVAVVLTGAVPWR